MENLPNVSTVDRREEWDRSAGHYDDYATRERLYRESAEFLVELARPAAGMTVVDLACGTGMVTEALLRKAGDSINVIAVDFSRGMLAYAARRVAAQNVAFHCGEAERLSQVTPRKVDRILCNAAFWHFDTEKVLAEISKILKPTGQCLITLPAGTTRRLGHFSQLYDTEKFIWMILEEKDLRGHLKSRMKPEAGVPDRGDVLSGLAKFGLRVQRVENLDIYLPPRDYIAFLRIPIMAKNSLLFRGMPEPEVDDILSVVAKQIEWAEIPDCPITWQVHVIEHAA